MPALRVLVVEDDPDDFFLVEELLRSELHATTQQAASVDDALRNLDSDCYHAILLDYALGARTGLDLLAELQAHNNVTPVVFLTGHGDETLAVRALKAGAVDYLSKAGLTAESLATAVRHALALREKDDAVRAAREAMLARERDYRTLFERANDPILIVDPADEKILEANPAASRLYGYSHEELLGRSLTEFSTDSARGRRAIEECLRAGEISNFQTVNRNHDGRQLHLLVNASVLEYQAKRSLLIVARDISDRIAAEKEIFRLNRALKALSKCSEALLRARDQQDFLEEICTVVVNDGGYRMAWVAAAAPDDVIRPLASSGAGMDYLEVVCRRYNTALRSSLLVPAAIRTGEPAVCRDTQSDPRSASMREECAQRGFASLLALPLRVESRIFGALAIYAGEIDAFDQGEVELLCELAGSVSYGLTTIEAKRQKEKAEEELRNSERWSRSLLETAEEGIWTIDAEDRTTFVNSKTAALLGYRPEEMLGRPVYDFARPTDLEKARQLMADQRRRVRGHYEVALLRADGTRIITSLNSSPILDANGNYAGALGMFTDITEQKRAEKKLRESERRYRTLFERNLAGVFRATADTGIMEANEAFVHMLGYGSIEQIRGMKLDSLCCASSDSPPCMKELWASGQLINREICVQRKDGSSGYLLANLVLLRDAAGAPQTIEGTVLDITQRRQLEAQLLQSQKMDAIGQLAGGIAHDFNNLLMVIRSYADLVGEKLRDESVRKEIDAILKAADRGAALTRQLLTFGRKQVFSPRLMDVNSVLENITKVLPRALGEDIQVEVHAGKGLWQVKADPVQIEQLLLNLAVNARDAMPSGGRLTLETANLVIDGDYVKLHVGVTPGEYVLIAVSDTGCGIPREILPRIFEPFFTTKDRGKGTGLGLSTVYGIVKQSGGYVWVYSEMGEGTVFKIYLPRGGASALADVQTIKTGDPMRGSETILLVEDEEAVRTAARTYLALRGYDVLEAGCGDDALRIADDLRERKIDLLITDVVMPGMSGSVLGQKMLEKRPEIRIMYVSGYTEATVAGRGLQGSFLQKPFSLFVLAKKVREVLDAPVYENQCVA